MSDDANSDLALVLVAFRVTLGRQAGPDDNFFEMGGDSVNSEEVIMRLEEATGLTLPGWTLLDYPTPRLMAGFLDQST